MRVKKHKRHRKVVRFFSACFGFREPFKVLCDGTFVHHLLHNHLTPADDALSGLLGGRTLLFTTRCIIGELKSLGESHDESLEAAQQLITARPLPHFFDLFLLFALPILMFSCQSDVFFFLVFDECCGCCRCDHEKRVSAMACIESVIGEGNSEHFFVATQDADIRKKFREIPGVPVIHGLRNSLFIEQPSALQREYVKSTEEKRLHATESDFGKLLKRELKGGLANDSGNEVLEEAQLMRKISTAKKMFGVAEKSKFKRKKAKVTF